MVRVGDNFYWTRALLGSHLHSLGLEPGDAVMTHAGLRSVGSLLNGPDALVGAIRDTIGLEGTLLSYVGWEEHYEDALDEDGYLPNHLKSAIPPFDAVTSRACRGHGVFAEFVRTTPGATRSRNPGASVAAVGHRAEWFTADHPLDYGYGSGSPFAKLVARAGKVLLVGAPWDTVSLLHHAEDQARLPGKRVRRFEVPLLRDGGTEWRLIEEFDTADPVVEGLEGNYFATVVTAFLLTGRGRAGTVGTAPALLLPAPELLAFAVEWLEQRFRS